MWCCESLRKPILEKLRMKEVNFKIVSNPSLSGLVQFNWRLSDGKEKIKMNGSTLYCT
jgi:hypothetical protein